MTSYLRFVLAAFLAQWAFIAPDYGFTPDGDRSGDAGGGGPVRKFTLPQDRMYRKGWIDFNKNGVKDVYEDPEAGIDSRVEDLLSQMTLEEKTCQMVTLYGYRRVLQDDLPTPEWKDMLWKDGMGAIDEHLNGFYGWGLPVGGNPNCYPASRHAWAMNQVQRFFVEQTRLGVPVDFTNEGIRGVESLVATNFPPQLGIGHTWDRELVREVGRVTGQEARLLGYTNIYAPILDVGRDQRWGRYEEVYGESPYLVAELGVSMVEGLQVDGKVAATGKHFVAYSNNKGAREGMSRVDPQMSPHEVENIHIYPWREVISRASLLGVMSSYNDYDGQPIQGSAYWLTERLRNDLGFRGYVVSDSDAVEYLHSKHRVSRNMKESVRQAVLAGLNVRCTFRSPDSYVLPLRELVEEGSVPMSVIDDRVRDILRVKFILGLFDDPYQRDYAAADAVVDGEQNRQVALRASRESLVLLKNAPSDTPFSTDGKTLPLNLKNLRKVAVIGPNADETSFALTHYGPCGVEVTSVLQGLRDRLGPEIEVGYEKGCELVDENWPDSELVPCEMTPQEFSMMGRAVELSMKSDVSIVVVGGGTRTCGENKSRSSLDLPGHQEKLLRAIRSTGKPMIVVLVNGRPLSINWADRNADAILEAWYPGSQGGRAVAEALCGDFSPGGKLTVTFPKTVGQIPLNFPYKPFSQIDGGKVPGLSGNQSRANGALYEFGYGLSYTTFRYSDLELSDSVISPEGSVKVSFTLTNTGNREGDEIVQLYVRDRLSSITVYEMRLRGFERVSLKPGESRRVEMLLDARKDLAILDRDFRSVVEPGAFEIIIGASSEDHRLCADLVVTNPDGTSEGLSAPDAGTLETTVFPVRCRKGVDMIFSVKDGAELSSVEILWGDTEAGSSFEISVTDGGGQFLPVFSSSVGTGRCRYEFPPVKASEMKISVMSGAAWCEGVRCDGLK
ncbi:MAG: glycoside hydrolase family 3 N-terminal domain-containing protein [Candidatus Cryptobacteroides sp.]